MWVITIKAITTQGTGEDLLALLGLARDPADPLAVGVQQFACRNLQGLYHYGSYSYDICMANIAMAMHMP